MGHRLTGDVGQRGDMGGQRGGGGVQDQGGQTGLVSLGAGGGAALGAGIS